MACKAGTADPPVAEESGPDRGIPGCQVERIYDIGVAGLHRTLAVARSCAPPTWSSSSPARRAPSASVVGGPCGRPAIAVPTSVGGGASFPGPVGAAHHKLRAALRGVTVVNIDNGFGAATPLPSSTADLRRRPACPRQTPRPHSATPSTSTVEAP